MRSSAKDPARNTGPPGSSVFFGTRLPGAADLRALGADSMARNMSSIESSSSVTTTFKVPTDGTVLPFSICESN